MVHEKSPQFLPAAGPLSFLQVLNHHSDNPEPCLISEDSACRGGERKLRDL